MRTLGIVLTTVGWLVVLRVGIPAVIDLVRDLCQPPVPTWPPAALAKVTTLSTYSGTER